MQINRQKTINRKDSSQTHFEKFIQFYDHVKKSDSSNACCYYVWNNCKDNDCPSFTIEFLKENLIFYIIRHVLDLNILREQQIQNVICLQVRIDAQCVKFGEEFKQFLETFPKCPNIMQFDLSCFLGSQYYEYLQEMPFIFHNHASKNSLTKISIQFSFQNTFLSNANIAERFFNDLSQFKSIQFLTLALNAHEINNTMLEFLSHCISLMNLQKLNLYLSLNHINPLGAQLLCSSISNRRHSLMELILFLEENFLMDKNTCITIIESITQCFQLQSLELQFGELDFSDRKMEIASMFYKLEFLNFLVLHSFLSIWRKNKTVNLHSFRSNWDRYPIIIRKMKRLTFLLINW